MQITIISEYKNMWEIIKDILKKKACFHDWKLVKETEFGRNKHYIYICQKCGEIKEINVTF
jgi:Fe2+ or Zn2+ uptake regulation protein